MSDLTSEHYTQMRARRIEAADSSEEIRRRRAFVPHAANLDPYDLPLEKINPANPELFYRDLHWRHFARLRKESPVHWTDESSFGPYWSLTKFGDILRVEGEHSLFSSDWTHGGITIGGMPESSAEMPMFIAMDPPRHDVQRMAVAPRFTQRNLKGLEGEIRERAGRILDGLPRGETFDWVSNVSIELTAQMLAILFDIPQEDRMHLIRWSDAVGGSDNTDDEDIVEHVWSALAECGQYFAQLWNDRVNSKPRMDLVSMLAHGENTRNMGPGELLGNAVLLIVGGNDTTRNSISGGLFALNRHPDQYRKLLADPNLITSMVPEIIRWQTPLAHMRRTATADAEVGGMRIRAGDKVVLWYVSGNRDEEAIDAPDDFIINRPKPRHHLSFGFGLHRCLGNRLAEMQLRIVWEEILARWPDKLIQVVAEPDRVKSCFVKGYRTLPVCIPT